MKLLYILLGIAAVIGIWFWSGYNGLITAQENVDTAWADIETQYQRRMDLIPNLVSTVKGAAEFESSTFREITEARSAWQGASSRADKISAATGMEGALGRLLLTFENYPQLQATQAYRDLMVQLEGTENRISVARRDFNAAVRSYNLNVKRFPRNLIAGWFGFEEDTFFEADEGADVAPSVDF